MIDAYLESVGARRLADGEWGLTVAEADPRADADPRAAADPRADADAHPLDIGIRIADGLIRIQAFAVPAADAPSDEDALHWNRSTRVVRFARTRSGDLWVQADLFVADADSLDSVLGLVVEAARSARAVAYDAAPTDGGWLGDARGQAALRKRSR